MANNGANGHNANPGKPMNQMPIQVHLTDESGATVKLVTWTPTEALEAIGQWGAVFSHAILGARMVESGDRRNLAEMASFMLKMRVEVNAMFDALGGPNPQFFQGIVAHAAKLDMVMEQAVFAGLKRNPDPNAFTPFVVTDPVKAKDTMRGWKSGTLSMFDPNAGSPLRDD